MSDSDPDDAPLTMSMLQSMLDGKKGKKLENVMNELYDCIKTLWFYRKYDFPEGTKDEARDAIWEKGDRVTDGPVPDESQEVVCPRCSGPTEFSAARGSYVCLVCATEFASSRPDAREWHGATQGGNISGIGGSYYQRLDAKGRPIDPNKDTDRRNQITNQMHQHLQGEEEIIDPDTRKLNALREKFEPNLDDWWARVQGSPPPVAIIQDTFLFLKEILGLLKDTGKTEPGNNNRWALIQRLLYIVCQRAGFSFVTIRVLSDIPAFRKLTTTHRNQAENLVASMVKRHRPRLDGLRLPEKTPTAQTSCTDRLKLNAWQNSVIETLYGHLDYIDNAKKRRLVAVTYFLVDVRPSEGIQILGAGSKSQRVARIQKYCPDIAKTTGYLQGEIKRLKEVYVRQRTKQDELNAALDRKVSTPPKDPSPKVSPQATTTPNKPLRHKPQVEDSSSSGSGAGEWDEDADFALPLGSSDAASDQKVSTPPKKKQNVQWALSAEFLSPRARSPHQDNQKLDSNMGLTGKRLAALFPAGQFRRVGSHQDGTCFFHSVLYLLSAQYRRGDAFQKKEEGLAFRKKYADDYKRHFGDSKLDIFGWKVKKFKRMLRDPTEYVGQELWSIVSREERVNIIIIHLHNDQVYCASYAFDDAKEYIIVVYIGEGNRGHYEPLVQVNNSDNQIVKTKFTYTDQVIIKLKESIANNCKA